MIKRCYNSLKLLYSQKQLLIAMAKREVQSQYVGSFLGFMWTIIQPAVMVTVFWFVFSVGFKSKPVGDVPFVVWLAAGMAPWFAFSAIVSSSANAVIQYGHLIKKTVFPSQVLPIVKLLSSMVGHAAFMLILIVLILANHIPIGLFWLQVIYYFGSLCLFSLGIGLIVAALNVFVRDITQIVGVVLQVGFWVTPIFWDIHMMPQKVQTILKFNPVYYFIQGYRDTFVKFTPFWQHELYGLYFWIITISLLMIGSYIFNKLRPQFADVL